MVHRNRWKRLKVSSQLSDDDSSDAVAEFNDPNHSSDADFQASFTITEPKKAHLTSLPSGTAQTWVEKYADITNQTGLITSTRKSKEISAWLRGALQCSHPCILVLTGPPGSGKTSALKAAATELCCSVLSWQAPVTGQSSISMTLLEDFQSFFIGARYRSLQFEGDEADAGNQEKQHKLLLVDDLPVTASVSIRNREMVQRIFSDVSCLAPYPTVVVVSDSERGIARVIRFLLGQELLSSPNVETIKVPAVTDTAMKCTLRQVLCKEGISVARHQLDGTIASSNGDIRAALNALHFCVNKGTRTVSQRGKPQMLMSREQKRKRRTRSNSLSSKQLFPALPSVTQDATLGTYHAVSKILNNKRKEDGSSKYAPEDILEEAKADPSSFLAFLHHNYPEYFGDINDIVPALTCLCDADCLLLWIQDDLTRTLLNDCAASVATRGFLLYNHHPIRTGWRPVRGPEFYAVAREGKELTEVAQQQFSQVLRPAVFTTSTMCETIPFAEKITGTTLKEWGRAKVESGWLRTHIVDPADIAMVSLMTPEESKVKAVNSSFSISDSEEGDQDENVEEIEEWND